MTIEVTPLYSDVRPTITLQSQDAGGAIAARAAAESARLSAEEAAASEAAAEADRVQTGLDRVQTGQDRAQTSLDASATAQDRVQTGQDRTATGADRVQTGQDRSTASSAATVATTQAGIAINQAQAAAVSAGEAEDSADTATAAATVAVTHSGIATTKASEAAASAQSALSSKNSATSQAETATTKASEAAASAAAALISQTSASGSAQTATTKASEASASAQTATAQAGTATTKANEASASAQTASTQAGIASTKASEASGSAQTATAQAGTATTKASEASASAQTASTKASEASASAAAAAGSASSALESANSAEAVLVDPNLTSVVLGLQALSVSGEIQAVAANLGAVQGASENANIAATQAGNAMAAALTAQTAANNAVAVVTGGTASLTASPGRMPIADATGKIDPAYVDLLAGVSTPLHRSPNAITAMFLYDTSKDSDGGAWTEKCQHTSWYNETLSGKWLGTQESEVNARNTNAMLGPELVANGGFSNGTEGWLSYQATLSVSSGSLDITATAVGTIVAYQSLSGLVPGRAYVISIGQVTLNGRSGSLAAYDSPPASSSLHSGLASSNRFAQFIAPSDGAVAISFVFTSTAIGQVVSVNNISVKEVTAQTTAANDYFQLTSDGKFYALSKNLLTSTSTLATQTQWLTAGTYTLSSTTGSSGSVAISGAATASHTAGTPTTFTVATSGNVTFTVTGSVLTAQCELGSVATTYSANASTARITEVFRGNKRSFPKVAGIVAEAANLTIYDLTEPGRPMWMRFVPGIIGSTDQMLSVNGANTGVDCKNAHVLIGQTQRLIRINFILDNSRSYSAGQQYMYRGNIAQRNSYIGYAGIGSLGALASATVNAVAMTVLPDAPHDPVTGLKVPTIAVATGGGISVIQNTGIVRNSSSTSAFTQITLTPQLLSAGREDALWYFSQNPNALGASFALTSDSASVAPDFNDGNTSVLKNKDRATLARCSGAVVQMLRNHEAAVGKGVAAKLSNTFNAGHLLGDIRRCFLADTVTGSVTGTVSDRSYKAATGTVTGTLTAAAVANNAQLVAYSGFSAANYAREPYSADLDFGTGEWSVGAWVNTTQPAVGGNLLTWSEQFDNGAWTKTKATITQDATLAPNGTGTADKLVQNTENDFHYIQQTATVTPNTLYTRSLYLKQGEYYGFSFQGQGASGANAALFLDLRTGTITSDSGLNAAVTPTSNGWYRLTVQQQTSTSSLSNRHYVLKTTSNSLESGDGTSGIYIWGAQLELGSTATTYKPTTNTAILPVGALAHRSFSSGPEIKLQMTYEGKLQAVAFDGTTTRTVTTAAAYNTATWTKVRATYTTDGTLGLTVNGQPVATTTGAPLLTLNNSNAVLTIGNSFALDAPFPGSISLLKFTATVPTAEQAQWMYEQEKQLFLQGAQCVLPSSGNVLDLAYDDETDTWSALQATHESTWSGLVRTSTQTPSAGSFAKCVAGSGNKLLARTTTNPGVDIQMPARNLRAELRRRGEAMNANQDIVVFDYFGGFTATTTLNSTALTSVAASLYPSTTNLIGCAISGTGIPASTVITGISGTTIYMSKAATANGSSIQISTTDFNLPVGYTARSVMTAGALKREGSTADYTRLFNGFRETIRFAVAPGHTAWVQIQAVKEVA